MFEDSLTASRKRCTLITAIAFAGLLVFAGLSQAASKPPPPPPPPSMDPAIVYQIDRTIYVANADGTNKKAILSVSSGSIGYADWSPRGDEIIFVSTALFGPGIYRVKINRSTGGILAGPDKMASLNPDQFIGSSRTPRWSPATIDGREYIAFSDYPVGSIQLDVYLLDPDTLETFNLTNTPDLSEVYPSWSPDVNQLLVMSAINRGADNWVDDPELDLAVLTIGTNCLNDNPVCETAPRVSKYRGVSTLSWEYIAAVIWSNTGEYIAAVALAQSSTSYNVWIIPTDDPANPIAITDPRYGGTAPSWSPDDRQIMYWQPARNTCGKRFAGLVVENTDGTPIGGCLEKGLIPDGRYNSWWRNHGLVP